MAAARLQSCHLGRTNIEGVWPSPEGACATSQLVMGFQQSHVDACISQKGGGGESGDATADHEYVQFWLHQVMLAVQGCRA